MNRKKYSIDNLTEEQLRLITETLLYASTVEVHTKWYYKNYKTMFDLALDIRKKNPEVLLKNTFIMKENFEDEFSKEISNYFPELELN